MYLSELTAAFLAAKQYTWRPNTRRAFRYDLGVFARSFPSIAVADLTAKHLRAFLAATADRAPATLARRRAALRSCFSWAYGTGLILTDPSSHLERISLPQRDPRPLAKAEVEALLAAIPARHRRNRLLFTLLYETGMRVGEGLALGTADVHLNDLDGGYLRVKRIVPLIDAPRSLRMLRSSRRTEAPWGRSSQAM